MKSAKPGWMRMRKARPEKAWPESASLKNAWPGAAWPQQLLWFALFFAGLMLLHAPLLRLPYFWDEAGYYIPAARDLLLGGRLIPKSTPSNAHPPLVMAWLALAWRVFGYSTLVTRTAMLALSAFSLLGFFRLARITANWPVAIASTALVAIYPVYFTQSSLAQVDLPAAGFTFWGLAAYLALTERSRQRREEHTVGRARLWVPAIWFSAAVLAKETAILAPLALFGWQALGYLIRLRTGASWRELLPPPNPPLRSPLQSMSLLIPILPLAAWYVYHDVKTGFLLGNPEFFRYNVAATLSPLRIPMALAMRLWQVSGYLGLYLLTLSGVFALLRPPQIVNGVPRPRIALSVQGIFLAVLIAYLVFMSTVGGAVLARYMLSVVPLVILEFVATLWRRVRHWEWITAAIGVGFAAALFVNPPYGFSLEDNLAYRDYIILHAEASRELALQYPAQRVLTAWPASDELTRPWLGYVSRPFRVLRVEDFSSAQIDLAAKVRGSFDVALVFSTKYEPSNSLLENLQNWPVWLHAKERFFGYHRDLSPEDVATRLDGTIAYHQERNGQWVAIIAHDSKLTSQ